VLEVSKAYIASVAKKTSDVTEFVAVINMESSATSAFVAATDRALSILFGQHFIVSTGSHTVHCFASVIFEPLRICVASAFLVLSHFLEILTAPFTVQECSARLAINVVPRHGMFAWTKFAQRLFHLALRASFEAGRQIKIDSTWHVGSPFRRNNYTSNYYGVSTWR
jgi:hypothetical protein